MNLAVDVQYQNGCGYVAGVLFEHWDAQVPSATCAHVQAGVAEYVPGQFYQRELPCILGLLATMEHLPATIVIDGFVFLDGHERPGLGKHLNDALDGKVAVIGVAKSAFHGIGDAHRVLRPGSAKPLFVTCIGTELEVAKAQLLAMHGPHRMPVLLKLADQLCRAAVPG